MKTFSRIFFALAIVALFAALSGATHQLLTAALCGAVGLTCHLTRTAENNR